jgi:hypothetical protein
LRRLRGQARVEGQHHGLLHAAARELGELVAQRANARGGDVGLALRRRKVVARVRLEREHTARDAAVRGFAVEQRQHGLVAAVHAVEVANGQCTGRRDVGVVETTKDFH